MAQRLVDYWTATNLTATRLARVVSLYAGHQSVRAVVAYVRVEIRARMRYEQQGAVGTI